VERVPRPGRVDHPGAARGDAPEAPTRQGESTPGAERHDRLAPGRFGQGPQRLARVRVAAGRDEFFGHDCVVHVGEKPRNARRHPVEVADDPRTRRPGAPDRTQGLGREVPVDHQHPAAVDLVEVECGGARLEAPPVGNHEPPLARPPVDEDNRNGGLEPLGVKESPGSDARRFQFRADEAPFSVVSQPRKHVGFAAQGRNLADRVTDHAPSEHPTLPVAHAFRAARQIVHEIAVIDDTEPQAHDTRSQDSLRGRPPAATRGDPLGLSSLPTTASPAIPGDSVTVLLLASAGALLAAALLAARVAARSGEARVYLLTAVFLLLAAGQGVALFDLAGHPLGLDLPTAGAAAALAAGLLGCVAVVGIARTLRELHHAEELHWESMESVRGLSEFAARRGKALEERLPHLLEDACQRFGLEIGFVSRVVGTRYEIVAIHAPPEFPVASGAVYALERTPCRETLASERPVARAEDPSLASSEIDADLRFGTYLASAIRVAGENFGTLVFAKNGPANTRLTATHKDLVHLMAQWLGWEFEELARPDEEPTRLRPHREGKLRVDTLLRRAARRARRSLPKGVRIETDPGPAHLPTPREARLPLDAILASLVHRTAQAIAGGGVVRVAAGVHEPPSVAPDLLPGVAPARYVTLTVSESSGALDPDAIARGFTAETPADMGAEPAGGEFLPLPAVYRMLQRAGGDLSVEVEPGRGSRFTIFLPLGQDAERPAPRRPAATEPAPPMAQPR